MAKLSITIQYSQFSITFLAIKTVVITEKTITKASKYGRRISGMLVRYVPVIAVITRPAEINKKWNLNDLRLI